MPFLEPSTQLGGCVGSQEALENGTEPAAHAMQLAAGLVERLKRRRTTDNGQGTRACEFCETNSANQRNPNFG